MPLLAYRFHFKVRLQPEVTPTDDLVALHGGPKCKLSQEAHTDSSFNINGYNTEVVLTAKNASMSDLAQALGDQVHRKVEDRTGVNGTCDITLKWTADDAAADAQSESIVSIFTAVQEQLGLKLQSTKGPVDTLVIDHVEMPSQN